MNYYLLYLTPVVSARSCDFFFPIAGGFFAQSFNGCSCFAIATAIFMANPGYNVLNQFNTQTTLHRHYRDGISSSIKMIHNLFRSYTTNSSQQSPLLRNMKQISETVPLMLKIYSIAFTAAYYGKDWRSVFKICSTTHLVFTKTRRAICHVSKERRTVWSIMHFKEKTQLLNQCLKYIWITIALFHK